MSSRETRLAWAWIAASAAPAWEPPGVHHQRPTGFAGRFLPRDRSIREITEASTPDAVEHHLVPISSYADLPPRQRPPAYCPACHEQVWLKLGRRVRHHYAHLSESRCGAAGGEGALHLGAKLHLAAKLEPGDPLTLEYVCHGAATDRRSASCSRVGSAEWPVTWDEVRVEHRLPALRADLLLLRAGSPVGAIEVYASNAIGQQRARKYRELGIPWIEVVAEEILGKPRGAWSSGSPLVTIGDSRLHPDSWRCGEHQRLHLAWLDHQRTGEHPVARRIAHIYQIDAGLRGAERRIQIASFSMIERRVDGAVVGGRLERDDSGAPVGRPVVTADPDEARHALHQAFREWVRWMREHRGAQVDSPMRWMGPEDMPSRGVEALFPQRLRWDVQTSSFIGAPNRPRLAWPVRRRLESEADPVLGFAPCFWTSLPHRDREAEIHAVVDRCWVVISPREWTMEGSRQGRADITVFRHTGVTWEQVVQDHTAQMKLASGVSAPWSTGFAEVACALIAAVEDLARGSVSIADVVERARSLAKTAAAHG